MLYILAIFLPPVAVLLTGKPFQAFINLILCFFLWIPAVIHAFFVINQHNADRRNDKLIRAVEKSRS